ncbi:DUF11 domain-containing protein [Streptomyces bambusae]|uniref:DUF11 domain-containing protein n=1 Tax=Streptomyces bambusae TaxID=1550616 RepID=UPI001CFEDED5|nr:DUF11 domain-containing protein [Streptomyces bambusae]MCB5164618.1 DUF11 domain-containing protein [Streptomyces bambusae]
MAPEAGATTPKTTQSGEELLKNGSFEHPEVTPTQFRYVPENEVDWKSTAGEVEVWGAKHRNVDAPEGNQLIELTARAGMDIVYQWVDVDAGDELEWSVNHLSRYDADKMQVVFGHEGETPADFKAVKPQGAESDTIAGTKEWKTHSGKYVVPEGQKKVAFGFKALSEGNLLDSASLKVVPPASDPAPTPAPGQPAVETGASAQTVQREGKVAFTTTVKKPGTDSLHEASLIQDLPAHATLVPDSVKIDGEPAGEAAAVEDGKLTVRLGKDGVLDAESAVVTYELQVAKDAPAGAKFSQSSTLSYRTGAEVGTAPVVQGNTVTVGLATADLAVDGWVQTKGGTKAEYQVRVTNNGPQAAHGVQLKGVSDVALTGKAVVDGAECGTVNGKDAGCSLKVLESGKSAVMTVTGDIGDGKLPTVEATATSATDDPQPANNKATLATATADVAVELTAKPKDGETKAGETPKAKPGSEVTFTMKVTNNGPSAADKVRVVTELPEGFTAPAELKDMGTVPSGESRTVEITGTVPEQKATEKTADAVPTAAPDTGKDGQETAPAEKIVATATVGTDAFDPKLDNQKATAEVEIAAGGGSGSEEGDKESEGLLALTGANGALLLALGTSATLAAAAGAFLFVRSRRAARAQQ